MSTQPLPLPLSDIIQVSVSAAIGQVAPRPFNQGLIVGPSAVIPSYGAGARIQEFPSVNAMLTAGFINSDPEVIAATLYFSQNPAPFEVWIGRQDLTAIQIAVPHSGAAGTGYVPGDLVGVVQGGGSNGQLRVATVGAGGAVTALSTIVGLQGTGYTTGTGLGTTGGTGTGLEVDITAVGETCLEAVEACALANNQFYGVMCCGAADSDHLALGAYSSANWQTLLYFGSSPDVAIANGTAGNLFLQMQAVKDRAFMSYNTTQGGEYPTNLYAAAAALGAYCGFDTGLPSSAFTLAFKSLIGIAPEPLTQTQYQNILNANGNVSATYGQYQGLLYPGILESGEFFDQILYRATLVNLLQVNEMNVLVSLPKVPQTDAGEHLLIAAAQAACSTMALVGYLGPGTWEGPDVFINPNSSTPLVSNGDAMPEGYIVGAPPYSTQSAGARAARQAMPITCCIFEAGAVNSLQIQVLVDL